MDERLERGVLGGDLHELLHLGGDFHAVGLAVAFECGKDIFVYGDRNLHFYHTNPYFCHLAYINIAMAQDRSLMSIGKIAIQKSYEKSQLITYQKIYK